MEKKVLQDEKDYLKKVESEIETLQTASINGIKENKLEIERQKNILQVFFMTAIILTNLQT